MSASCSSSSPSGSSSDLLINLQIRNAVLETELAHAKQEKDAAVNSSALVVKNLTSFILSSKPSSSADTTSTRLTRVQDGTQCACHILGEVPYEQTIDYYKRLVQVLKNQLEDRDNLLRESLTVGETLQKAVVANSEVAVSLKQHATSKQVAGESEVDARDKLISRLKNDLEESKRGNERLKTEIVTNCVSKVQNALSTMFLTKAPKKAAAAKDTPNEAAKLYENVTSTKATEVEGACVMADDMDQVLESSLIGDEYTSTCTPNPIEDVTADDSFITTSTLANSLSDEPTKPTIASCSEDADMIDLEAVLNEAEYIIDDPHEELSITDYGHSEDLGKKLIIDAGDVALPEMVKTHRVTQSFTSAPSVLSVGLDASKSMVTTGRYGGLQAIPSHGEVLSAEARWKLYSRPQTPRRFKCGDFVDPTFDVDNLFYDPPEKDEHPYRAVLIQNLPSNITIGEVLARVRGGMVYEAHLAPTITITGSMSAIVRFIHGTSAERYAEFASEYSQTFGGQVAKVDLIPTPSHPLEQSRWRGINHLKQTRIIEIKKFPSALTVRDMECDIAACSPIGAPQKYYEMVIESEGKKKILRILCNSIERAGELMRNIKNALGMIGLDIAFGEDPCKGWIEEIMDCSQNIVNNSSRASDIESDLKSQSNSLSGSASIEIKTNGHPSAPNTQLKSFPTNIPCSSVPTSWADEVIDAVETGALPPLPSIPIAGMKYKDETFTRRNSAVGLAASRYSTNIPFLDKRRSSHHETHHPRRPSSLHTSFSADDLENESSESFKVLSENVTDEVAVRRDDEDVTIIPLGPISIPLPSSPPSSVEPVNNTMVTESGIFSADETDENKENTPPQTTTHVISATDTNSSIDRSDVAKKEDEAENTDAQSI